MYPDLEKMSNFVCEKPPQVHHNKSSLQQIEKNCNQIFSNQLDLFDKIAPTKTYLFGKEFRTNKIWVVAGLLMLFLFSLTGIVFMWFTNSFQNMVYSNLVLVPGSNAFQLWQKPTVKPLIKVHLFNYTNVEDFKDGKVEKLHVKEIGPYVYEETTEKVNVHFNGSTVSYQDYTSYKFLPEESKGRQNDRVVVPNVPLLSAAAAHKHSNFFTRLGLNMMLTHSHSETFWNIPADHFIIGYEDDFYSIAKNVMKLQDKKVYDKFGLFSSKLGLQPDVYTIDSGVDDIDQLTVIKAVNGNSEMDHWTTHECNSVSGTDGTRFSPVKVQAKQPLRVFLPQLCRVFPLTFQKETTVLDGRIPAYKYILPETVFDSAENTKKNQCFCDMESGSCPLQGTYNITACSIGAPMFASFPHFYKGDPSLLEGVTGLNPKKAAHESFMKLHPTMGFPMHGVNRLQFNVHLLKSFGISALEKFKDGTMLPMAWFELEVSDKRLPQDVIEVIYMVTFTVKTIEGVLKYGSIIMAIVTLIPILTILGSKLKRKERSSSTRSLRRIDEESSE